MANGKKSVKATAYREGQNVIRDGRTKKIVYIPPEARDVKGLMGGLVNWINKNTDLSCPIVAGIAHYQFATIHPYYDGNGRTA
jgi:Fic family protein